MDFNKRKQDLTTLPSLALYHGNKEILVTTDWPWISNMAKARQRRNKPNCIRQPLPNSCRKKLLSDRQTLEPRLKKTINKQYSAQITQWLDMLTLFDISLKHTAGKEIKFTDSFRRSPTDNPEPKDNYENEFVINAISQLATVNSCLGRIFDQSDGANAVNKNHHSRYAHVKYYATLPNKQSHIDSNCSRKLIEQPLNIQL